MFYCDNYYTRHSLASELKRITDGEARIIGTIKYNLVDSTNRLHLAKAMRMVEVQERGVWCLVRCYNPVDDLEKLKREWVKQEKKKPEKKRKKIIAPTRNIAEDCGFLLWKDNKLVVFYTNDLHKTPSKHILDSRVKVEYDEGMLCCNGMGKVDRWQGDENLHRSEVDVPVIVCAYNMFMNSVDRMDQKRSTNPCRRKEMKLHMTLWTYYLDLAVIQGYAIFQVINPSSRITLQDFKRGLCEEMVSE